MIDTSSPTAQIYSELQRAFDHYNICLFDGKLSHCLITLQRKKRTYGYFSSERFMHWHDKRKIDEIAINPSYFAVVPLLESLQTLVHEMVHAWQFHYGKPGRRGYHNKEWADKMEAIGLVPSRTGKPGGERTGKKMADYALKGGLFMAATETLLTQDFKISWLDRFPSTSRLPIVVTNDGDDKNISGTVTIPLTSHRSNCIKYRCPSCGAHAWGQPSLRLLCGVEQCKAVAFDPVEGG